jgi:hypothetical protein
LVLKAGWGKRHDGNNAKRATFGGDGTPR